MPDAPVVTTQMRASAERIVALDPAARTAGLTPGMALADARALYPALVAVPAEPEADRQLRDDTAAWCRRWTPLVATDGEEAGQHGIMLDITGVCHLFDGEAALLDQVRARLGGQGLSPRLVAACHPVTALLLARAGCDGLRVPPGAEAAHVAPLPIGALGDTPAAEALVAAGLGTIGDVLMRPRAALAARFGADFMVRLDCARGAAPWPLAHRLEAPAYMAERRLAVPLLETEAILAIAGRLAKDLAQRLTAHGEGATALELLLFRTDGATPTLMVRMAAPCRDAGRIMRLLCERLETCRDDLDPGFGFDMIRLSVLAAVPLGAVALSIDEDDHGASMAELLDRLAVRLGSGAILALEAADTHWPEAASRLAPRRPAITLPGWSGARCARPNRWHQHGECAEATAPLSRPLRLLGCPEPIEVIAEVPDGAPLRFRWRRVLHQVARAEGPERLAPSWWQSPGTAAMTRDYFRVETTAGQRLWLFRAGLYARETLSPRWFLQGLMA